jgi:hypothetical protein
MTENENELCYAVTTAIDAPAKFAFAYLADVTKVGGWALGAFDAKPAGAAGAYAGTSLYDGSPCAFAVDADERRLLVDYLVGDDAKSLVMRISARVVPGEIVARGPDACLVSMAAWRPKGFEERRWSRLKAFHDAEIHIVRDRIEKAWAKK